MAKKIRLAKKEKYLIRRYLVWCYKTTKEELDKIDRYFTQLIADDFILKQLKKAKEKKHSSQRKSYKDLVIQFQVYMKTKEINALKRKFKNSKKGELNPEYEYLQKRLNAIEEAIKHFFGVKELDKICTLYEEEMTKRILQARGHD